MSPSAGMLLALIVVGAVLLVVHAIAVWQSLRSSTVAWKYRWLAFLPPATPIVAWRSGRRSIAIVWLVLVASYVILRVA